LFGSARVLERLLLQGSSVWFFFFSLRFFCCDARALERREAGARERERARERGIKGEREGRGGGGQRERGGAGGGGGGGGI
jgi:hypothetical protein